MSVELTLDVQQRGALLVHAATSFLALGVDAFFTDRSGGVSAGPYASLNLALHVGDDQCDVQENRRRVACAMGAELDDVRFVNQVHGSRVLDALRADESSAADAIFCSSSRLALAILVADCVPILLADETNVAVVHAGWRGLRDNVIGNALSTFADPVRVHALLGPSISHTRYQVGPEVATFFRDVPGALVDDDRDRFLLDLREVAAHQLRTRGLPDAHVFKAAACTDEGVTFFSDRAQRPCGRFALVAKRSS